MSVPKPPVKLGSGCSAIFANTLYTFQSDAFQSLPLKEGAEWTQLSMGVSVDKAKCVVGVLDGQDALFVVGGISKENKYSGLQRYTFKDKRWKTIDIPDPNLRNRQMHGAAYLNATKSILIYAGYQNSQAQDSSQTFTISTTFPYVPKSYTSKAPPGTDPILLPWNATHAVMAGGSPSNQQVWVFSEDSGWAGVPIVLPSSKLDMTKVQASLIQGDNSSKILELFDLGQSPNKVTTLMVQPAKGQSMENDVASALVPRAADLTRRLDSPSDQGVNLAQLPQYDGTDAPKDIRTSYALAQSGTGLVVITGGDGAQVPLAMFNQTGNSWVNAQRFFDGSVSTVTASPPSTSSASASSTVTAAPAATTEAEQAGGTNNTRIILGSVLGGLFGIAAICIIILLLFRRHKSRTQPDGKGSSFDQSRQLQIDDTRVGVARDKSPAASMDSLKRGQVAKGMISNPRIQNDSRLPSKGLTSFPSVFTNAGGDEARAPRDQGWSQYFAGDNPSQGNHASAYMSHDTSESRLTTYTEGSDYTNSSHPHVSAEVPPLNIRSSQLPALARYGNDNETFLGTSSSEQESYDPIGTSRGQWDQRPPSSIYAESASYPHPGQRVLLSQFPGVPASQRASEISPTDDDDRGMRTMASRDFGGPPTMSKASAATSRKATGSSDPRSAGDVHARKANGDDMSWLNLGLNR